MRAIAHILIRHPSESPGPRASAGASALPRYSPQSVILRLWGVILGWILWGWADTRWLCSRLFVALAAFSRWGMIEISPDVFLMDAVGEGRDLFSVEHRRYFLYPHPKGVPYPSMPWNLHGRSIVAHKTGTSQTINLMLSTIYLVIKSVKQKVAGSCTSAATKSSIHFLLYFHSKNSHQEISECIHLLVFFSPS